MSQALDAALTTLTWFVVLYFLLLGMETAIRLFSHIFAMFKRGDDDRIAREYIAAVNKLADSRKRTEEDQQ